MAAGAAYYDADGVEQFQAAHVVVLACNGVGTPRLLLNSASGRFPNGLANSSGLVGRNLMFHPYAQVYGFDEPTDSNRAPPTCLWSKEFYETDLSRGFVRGYTFQFGRGVGPVAEAVASEAKGLIPWGAGHHAAFRRLSGHRLGLSAICEDLPEEHNRVTLDPVLKDSHGIPAPRIDYKIGENMARMMEHGVARGNEVLAAAEATDICVNSPILYGGWHLLGTARMGADPSTAACSSPPAA
jgi:choline dehydrogenase-like flavoprotein